VASANADDIGDRVRCTGTFRDIDGDLADPTAIVARVLDPLEIIQTFQGVDVIKDAVGVYFVDLDVDVPGIWTYRFEGTGVVVAAEETAFYVERSAFETGS
jgi:hypothetical protein